VKRNAIPNLVVDPAREALLSSAGGVLLREVVRVCGVSRLLSQALTPWRSVRARHDPGKIITDLAVAVALGGDCVADLAVVRAQPGLFGPVASDATVSRLVAIPPTTSITRCRPSEPLGRRLGPAPGTGADRWTGSPAAGTVARSSSTWT
jgi:hypothetical protein